MAPIVPRLKVAELVRLLEDMSGTSHNERDSERMLLTFCLNCPDPLGAMHAFLDAGRDVTDNNIVQRALSLPQRNIDCVPVSELAKDHPLRTWQLASSC
jgi:hypothetical protein